MPKNQRRSKRPSKSPYASRSPSNNEVRARDSAIQVGTSEAAPYTTNSPQAIQLDTPTDRPLANFPQEHVAGSSTSVSLGMEQEINEMDRRKRRMEQETKEMERRKMRVEQEIDEMEQREMRMEQEIKEMERRKLQKEWREMQKEFEEQTKKRKKTRMISQEKATLEGRLQSKDFRFSTDASCPVYLPSVVNNETLLHRIQLLRGWTFHHHTIELKIQMDLICDRRLVLTCNLRIYQIEWYLKNRERSSIDAETVMPCNQCLRKNAALCKESICNLFACWKYWSVRVPNNEIDKCVKDENIILTAKVLQYDDKSILMKCLTIHPSNCYKKTVSKIIEKKVYKLLAWSFDYMEVFLSIKDTDSKPVILVIFHRNKVRRYPKQILGIELILKPIQKLKNERRQRVIFPCDKKANIPSGILTSVFNDHSNLNEISCYKHQETSELIIMFHCWAKGIIPYGEDLFPKQVEGLKTEVKEGFAWFTSGDSLYLGDEIGVLRNDCVSSTGTAGGFLEKNKTSYLLTCAHVLYDENELTSSLSLPRLPVVSSDKSKVYGERCAFVFDHGKSEKTSVDAALVRLDEAVKLQATIPEEDYLRLKTAGFEAKPVFNSGKIADVRNLDLFNRCCIKFGSVTGLTRGSFCLHGKHARIKHIPLSLKEKAVDFPLCKAEPMDIDQDDITTEEFLCQRTSVFSTPPPPASFVMFNQIEIDSHSSSGNFFEIGDSGSLVFLRESDESLTAVGLAIGSTSEGTCIVTPITSVLEDLDNKIDPLNEKEKLHFKNNFPSVQPGVKPASRDANIGTTQAQVEGQRFCLYARNQITVSNT